jgi:hypothetical protein
MKNGRHVRLCECLVRAAAVCCCGASIPPCGCQKLTTRCEGVLLPVEHQATASRIIASRQSSLRSWCEFGFAVGVSFDAPEPLPTAP